MKIKNGLCLFVIAMMVKIPLGASYDPKKFYSSSVPFSSPVLSDTKKIYRKSVGEEPKGLLFCKMMRDSNHFRDHYNFLNYALSMHICVTTKKAADLLEKNVEKLKIATLLSADPLKVAFFYETDRSNEGNYLYKALLIFDVTDQNMLLYKYITLGCNEEGYGDQLLASFLRHRYKGVKTLYTFAADPDSMKNEKNWKRVAIIPFVLNSEFIPEAKDSLALSKQFAFFQKNIENSDSK